MIRGHDLKRVEGKIDDLKSSLDTLAHDMEKMREVIDELSQIIPSSSYVPGAIDTETPSDRAVPSTKFADIVDNLLKSVDQLNESAKKEGKHKFGISDMDVEIRAGIQMVDKDLHLSQLPQDEINSESVSSIRFSLRPVPVIKLVGDEIKKGDE